MSALARVVVISLLPACALPAQASGARGGVGDGAPRAAPALESFAAEHYLTIEGTAEVRVTPSELRVVLAVTAEGDSAKTCQDASRALEERLVASLTAAGIANDSIYVDFIALLPVYDWRIREEQGRQIAVEALTGYRLQDNVHVTVADEAQARLVVACAFGIGITDVIAVDHWSRDLAVKRAEALELALEAAKRKAGLLLSVFPTPPKPINVQETTRVVFPKDLYRSFESSYAQSFEMRNWQQEIPRISAFRPKNTYYEGFFAGADAQAVAMPSRPEISVVSTVRLYYAAPDRPAPAPWDKR